MIADWRQQWHASTGGQTDKTFPFGFVQLNSIGNGSVYDNPVDPSDNADNLSPSFGYAGLRWSQSTTHGYAPNPAQPNVFMATSLDTPDKPFAYTGINGVHDPGFNVHSPYKQPVGARLARAGLVHAYGESLDTASPYFSSVTKNGSNAIVTFSDCGSPGVVLPPSTTRGFEILVHNASRNESRWLSEPIVDHSQCTVTVQDVYDETMSASRLRYNWYSNPCGYDCYGCAINVQVTPLLAEPISGMNNFLPVPPFVVDL